MVHSSGNSCPFQYGSRPFLFRFVGSRQWIGSTELGFVLEEKYKITSKFMVTNSGTEVRDEGEGREKREGYCR